ncbi:MAG: hypothetical protein AUI36_11375 [Cyanobacteria bacterium 13_1_40CM_2_61_4]|nr:MAG: hypothetical protein AUI36_11375 [Cyanobacteria bacterium 13_1_40CM_2_61_4]
MPFVIVSIGIDYRDFQAIDQANGIHTDFAIVETIIDLFHGRPLENAHRIFKGHAVSLQVATVLFVIPTIAYTMYVHNVNMLCKALCMILLDSCARCVQERKIKNSDNFA